MSTFPKIKICLLQKLPLFFQECFFMVLVSGPNLIKDYFQCLVFVLVPTKGHELGFKSQKLHLEPSVLALEIGYLHNIGLNLS